MKNYEIESFIKSFLLFFVLISFIYGLYVWQNYTQLKHQLDTRILQEMKLFVYDPTSDRFGVDFVPPTPETTLLTLHHSDSEVYGYYKIPTMDNHLMKVILPISKYQERLGDVKSKVISGMLLYIVMIVIASLIFAYYSLRPIRRALRLNKEFMRDVIHDVNTPIASMAVNLKLMEKKYGDHISINRMRNNIETLGMMRENLVMYLDGNDEQASEFDLQALIDERFDYFKVLYPHLAYENNLEQKIHIFTQKRAFVRILDNIISNGSKYNQHNGKISIRVDGTDLKIIDTGKGIKNVDKVFRRHYKEGQRGMGIGLNIVWKFSKKLDIPISISSKIGHGTTVTMDITRVMVQ